MHKALRKILLAISLLGSHINGFSTVNVDGILKVYVKNYRYSFICNSDTSFVPIFNNIDSTLYAEIENQFTKKEFHNLFLLIKILALNHKYSIQKHKQDYIINDGMLCGKKTIIQLIRIAKNSNFFIPTKSSEVFETTGDLLYWASINKSKILHYNLIFEELKKKKKRVKK